MSANVYMFAGISFWGTVSGVLFYIFSYYQSQSIFSYIIGCIFVCALYTFAVVGTLGLKPKRSGHAFFYPVVPMCIFAILGIIKSR